MSYFLRIFCESAIPISRQEIITFVTEGVYFEETPVFEPVVGQEDDWGELRIHYDTNKRPLIFERNTPTNGNLFEEEIDEFISGIKASGPPRKRKEIITKLAATQQVLAIDIASDQLDDDCWELLDCLEAYLAGKYNGLVFAPNEGFYSSDLKLIYKWDDL